MADFSNLSMSTKRYPRIKHVHDGLGSGYDPRCVDCHAEVWTARVQAVGVLLCDFGRWVRRRTWFLGGSRVGARE